MIILIGIMIDDQYNYILNHKKGKNMKHRRNFTLVELLVVIAIIAILAGITMTAVMGASNRAEMAKAKQEATDLKNAVAAFEMEYGKLPKPKGYDGSPFSKNQFKWLIYVLQGADPSDNDDFGDLCSDSKCGKNPNSRRKIFLSGQNNSQGEYIDPWGKSYRITFETSHGKGIINTDGNKVCGLYVDKVKGEKSKNDENKRMIYSDVVVWSVGKDGKDSDTLNDSTNEDNIYTLTTNWSKSFGHIITK